MALVQVNPELRRELSKLRTSITMIAVIVLCAGVLRRLSATEMQRLSIENQHFQQGLVGSENLMA